jgi:hypothetical protein
MSAQTICRAMARTVFDCLVFAALAVPLCDSNPAFAESLVTPAAVRADSFCCDQRAASAIDNDLGTAWNSGRFPPASIVVDLGKVYPLSHIELLTAQLPGGTTEHQVSVSNDLVSWTNAYDLRSYTTDNQWLSIPIDLSGRYVSITTVFGPSWVAWREIRVFQQSRTSPIYGFWDEGFTNPKVRTNYDSLYKGTGNDPLTITSCLFSDCPHFPSTYSTSNAASMNLSSFSERQYWVLLDNNEPSNDNGCNSGPPDTSMPHNSPGEGIFGFAPIIDTAIGENFYRAHLVLNENFANPCLGGIAYMSFGAHSNRGNANSAGRSQLLGALNADPGIPHTVSFVTKLYEYEKMQAALYRLVVVATWPDDRGRDLPRMIQLNLFHDGDDDSSAGGPGKLRWSWPFAEDTFFPGAEVVYFDAEDVQTLCSGYSVPRMTPSNANVNLSYDIDLQHLFECAARWGGWSNGMPTTADIPVTSIDWAVEGQSTSGALWVAVHNMHMH